MMTKITRLLPLWLMSAAAVASLLPAMTARAQNKPDNKTPETPAQGSPAPAKSPVASPIQFGPVRPALAAEAASPATSAPQDRAQAYYHLALANTYEEEAVTQGRPELVTQAIEEYKLALNADPASPQLNDGLADLYFRTGRVREAESTARELLKNSPNDADAHKLLGRIFLRALSEDQNAPSSASPSGNVLDQAIAEYEKIVSLEPKSVEDRMVLGQLYVVKHDQKKAEEQFKTAQAIDPDAEEVVLNLARLYVESGDIDHAAKVIEAVPVADRTAKMETALGAAYDQQKKTKDAIAAYQRATDMEPGDVRTQSALAQALLNDNQLDEALKQFKDLSEADPEDADNFIHIGEILRRQGKYEDALVAIRKARKKAPESLEAGYNEGLLLDVLGRYDEAAQVYEKMVDLTSHANGAYTAEEKNNRGIFLERLGTIYHEQNKTDQAIAVYQKMIDMGGETATRGFEFQVDTLSEARLYDRAVEVSRKAVEFSNKAVEANPKDTDLKLKNLEVKLMLAGALLEQGKVDDGLTLAKGLLGNSVPAQGQDRLIWLKLGQYYTQLHRWKDAEDAYVKADPLTTKTDDRVYLLFLKGALAERQKHYEPAEQFFRQALALDPSNAGALNYLGYMLADKGSRLPEALKLIRKAVEIEPMNGAYLDSLGWVYFKLGQYELAEENLRQAVERDQTDPTVHDHLGDLYEKTGRIRLAAAQWELSLTQYAKSASTDVEPGDVAKVQRKLETARVKLAKQESATGQPKPE
ncbi:MAG: tetratricopeptide repeat protein [Terracidiphilus sp.]|jgi:tetratricopeptide (TPR) repeat protein